MQEVDAEEGDGRLIRGGRLILYGMCPVAVKRQAACEDKGGDRTCKIVGRVQGGSQNACTVKRYNQLDTASCKQIETELYCAWYTKFNYWPH